MSSLPEPELRYPPARSRATRSTIRPSRGASRVTIIAGSPPREIRLESDLEAKAALKYLADRDVVDVWEQPPPVAFRDASGQLRHHTFDFKLTLRSGERWLVEVKPWRRAEAMNLRARLRLIASQTSREIADRIVLVTEKVLDRDSVHNAALIHAMARRRDPEADAHVAAWMADRLGTVTIADLVTGTGLGGRGFCACIRLIADGTLVSTRSQRLDYSATVARAGAASGGIAA